MAAGLGSIVARDVWHKHLLGRNEYLQRQTTFFEKHLAPITHPFGHYVAYTIFMAMLLGFYELLAYALTAIFRRRNDKPL